MKKKTINLLLTLTIVMSLVALLSCITTFADSGDGSNEIHIKNAQLNQADNNHVYFGSYPQTEIVADASQCITYGTTYAKESDYIEDAALYEKLENVNWSSYYIKMIDGCYYYKLTRYNSTETSGCNWSNKEYHYFKYEPIRWRVLATDNDSALLFCDTVIDHYYFQSPDNDKVPGWSRSLIRVRLNSSSSDKPSYYTFNSAEKLAIIPKEFTEIIPNNLGYGSESYNTSSKMFLLSGSEVYGEVGETYGFNKSATISDPARIVNDVTPFARAMGARGNNDWILMSRAGTSYSLNQYEFCKYQYVTGSGVVEINGRSPRNHFNICPAMRIKIKSTDPITNGAVVSDMTLESDTYYYTGSEITPNVTISGLKKGKDYTVFYSNNVDVGTAVVTATGIGLFEGTITKSFEIKKHELSEYKNSLSNSSFTYDGQPKEPSLTIEGLSQDVDYEVSYENNVDAGTATVRAIGTGKYAGEVTRTFIINPKQINDYSISLSEYTYMYSGEEIRPSVSVDNLVEGSDFEVEYRNNVNEGKATVNVKGIGNYTGTISTTFTIEKIDISGYDATLSQDRILYDGEEKCPTVSIDGLVEGADYSVSYKNNINAGTATVTINGIGRYKGSITRNFVIWKEAYTVIVNGKTIGDYAVGAEVTITNTTEDSEIKKFSTWKIVSGRLPLSASQLKRNPLTFNMPENDVSIQAVYSGKSLEDELAEEDSRHNAVIARASILKSNIKTYTEAANRIKSKYGVSYLQSVTYYNNQAASTEATITKKQNYLASLRADTAGGHQVEIKQLEAEIKALQADYQMYLELKSAAQYQEKANNAQAELNEIDLNAEAAKHERIVATICENHYVTSPEVAEINYIRLDKDEYEYTGSEIHPIVTVIDSNGKKLGNESYDIVYPADCTSVGTHTITLKLKGMYVGTKSKSFKITHHTWSKWEVTKEPTCTEEGLREKTCSDCGKKVVESVEALGHNWNSSYTVDKEATCSEEGYESIHCKRCNETKTSRAIAKKPHSFTDWVILKEANCTETGLKEHTCTVCDEKETEEIPITHEYGEAVVLIEPTCTEVGLQERECSICHYIGSEEMPALGHRWNATYTVDKKATYMVAGSKSIHCSVCDEVKPGSTVKIAKKEKVDLPKATILTPVAAKKAATIKWKKVSTRSQKKIAKIQIQYSTDKNFKKNVKTVYAKKTATSKKITRLISKKTYYVRIRAYKSSGGVVHVSKWSTKKSVKIK